MSVREMNNRIMCLWKHLQPTQAGQVGQGSSGSGMRRPQCLFARQVTRISEIILRRYGTAARYKVRVP